MIKPKKYSDLSWDSHILLDIPVIDKQHAEFLAMIESVRSINISDDVLSIDTSISIINDLEEYSKKHFEIEESLLKKAGYENIRSHKKEHQYFINKIEEFKLERDFQSVLLLEKVTDFMKKWFLSHIIKSDMLYRGVVRKMLGEPKRLIE